MSTKQRWFPSPRIVAKYAFIVVGWTVFLLMSGGMGLSLFVALPILIAAVPMLASVQLMSDSSLWRGSADSRHTRWARFQLASFFVFFSSFPAINEGPDVRFFIVWSLPTGSIAARLMLLLCAAAGLVFALSTVMFLVLLRRTTGRSSSGASAPREARS